MGLSAETYALARKYTDDSMQGAGAVAGKPCQIQSITEITGGHRVTFLWVDNSSVQHTSTMDVMNGEVGEDGLGIKSVDINAQNHLIVTYDDDTTHDAGEIHGGTGEVISVNGKKGVVVLDASDVGALADDTEIPTKTSDLTNDDGFITKVVNDLTNYYTKSTTYTKTEVNDLINALSTLTLDIVETLPVSDISTTTIYLTPVSGQQNVYMQYIYVNNEWAQLGTTQADLSNYYTKTQMDASLLLKQDALTFDSAPTAGSINPVTSGGVYTALQNVDVPVATTQTAGKVKPDGTTITVDANGVISGANTLEGGNLISIDDDAINADIFVGTTAEWTALSAADKAKYTLVNLTDDAESLGSEIVDAVTNGVMNPVTSNAVFDSTVQKITTLSQVGITTGGLFSDFVKALPANSYASVAVTRTTFSDTPFGSDFHVHILKTPNNQTIHKSFIVAYISTQSSTSLMDKMYFGMVVYGTDETKWYKPTLTEFS